MTTAGWQGVVLVFLAAVGGVIGSFLNVVIYRLPAGRSIVWPGSHCPGCGHPIRWYDNLPVLSWFLLRGRCRDCQMTISWRYPAVEAATMGLFVFLGWWELMSGGQHLPIRPIQAGSSVLWMPWTGRELAALYAYHLMLCCTLLAAALIEHDHPRLDGRVWVRLFWPALVWGMAAAVIWPGVHPVPGFGPGPEGWPGRLLGLVDSLIGLGAGAAIGMGWALVAALFRVAFWGRFPPGEEKSLLPSVGEADLQSRSAEGEQKAPDASAPATPIHQHSGLNRQSNHSLRLLPGNNLFTSAAFWMPMLAPAGLVGLYLGWQAGLAVGLVSGLLYILSNLLGRWVRPSGKPPLQTSPPSLIPFSAWLGLMSLLWILFWKHWLDWGQRLF